MLVPIQNPAKDCEALSSLFRSFSHSTPFQRLPGLNSILRDHQERESLFEMEKMVEKCGEQLVLLDEQSRMLQRIVEDIDSEMGNLRENRETSRRPTLPVTPLAQLSSPSTSDLSLALVDFPSLPLYLKRRFTVHFKLINRAGVQQTRTEKLICRLSVHKMTPAGEEIKRARTGTPLMKGSLVKTFKPGDDLVLKDLMFNDISCQFPQGRVNILIRTPSDPSIKPLFLEGVRVKARKKRPDECY